ncbi:DUF4817 domain-containing protein [Caerostris extrusa]|uniref:DUF4817 domain-containing protein n=1 Tax=Caerostris extrusa TaxID=172846 RepID=A0AAV4T5L9_CAEEX|nr:DUF4817 domain-containing protein [Caerostris extrusa]
MSSRTSLNASRRNVKYECHVSRSGSRYGPINRLPNKPAHTFTVQGLQPGDFLRHTDFCEWLLQQHEDNNVLIASILWTDEARFTRYGVFNTHNSHMWSGSNPHAIRPQRHQVCKCVGRHFNSLVHHWLDIKYAGHWIGPWSQYKETIQKEGAARNARNIHRSRLHVSTKSNIRELIRKNRFRYLLHFRSSKQNNICSLSFFRERNPNDNVFFLDCMVIPQNTFYLNMPVSPIIMIPSN